MHNLALRKAAKAGNASVVVAVVVGVAQILVNRARPQVTSQKPASSLVVMEDPASLAPSGATRRGHNHAQSLAQNPDQHRSPNRDHNRGPNPDRHHARNGAPKRHVRPSRLYHSRARMR